MTLGAEHSLGNTTNLTRLPTTPRFTPPGAKKAWTGSSPRARIDLLAELTRDFRAISKRWCRRCLEVRRADQSKGRRRSLVGPYSSCATLRSPLP